MKLNISALLISILIFPSASIAMDDAPDLLLSYSNCISNLENIDENDVASSISKTDTITSISNKISKRAIASCHDEKQKLLSNLESNGSLTKEKLSAIIDVEQLSSLSAKAKIFRSLLELKNSKK